VISCEKSRKAAIIDPGQNSAGPILDFISKKSLIPEVILLTHSHWDHIVDVAFLKEKLKLPVAIHPLDKNNLLHPGSDGLPCWLEIAPTNPDIFLSEKENVQLGDLSLEILHTPGHSPGGVCFYCKSKNILISGDTLFKGSYGNISFSTAEPEKMVTSLKRLSELPPETLVYPGHGGKTTIGNEHWMKSIS